jgi:hypothetical protein
MPLSNPWSCRACFVPLAAGLLFLSTPETSVLAQTPQTPSNVMLLPGYMMTAVATGLNSPTAMTLFGDTIWVTELAGAVKQIDNKGNVTTKLTAAMLPDPTKTMVPPLTGIVFNRGWFWLIHKQLNSKNAPGVPVGVISRFKPNDPTGTFETVIEGFPSFGDHPNSQIVFGANGRAYINGAAPTNSSVVGPDNGWLTNTANTWAPLYSDFPGADVQLSGIGYRTLLSFALDPTATKVTYPFTPFGVGPVTPGTPVKAPTPMNPRQGIIVGGGTVVSFDPNAKDPTSTIRLEAWGFRNPYGVGFDPFNPKLLFVSNNGADVRQTTINGKLVIRGSRPIYNDWDDMFVINLGEDQDQDSQGNQNQNSQGNQDQHSKGERNDSRRVPFFGHPDYFHDFRNRGPNGYPPLPVTDPLFCPPGLVPPPQPVKVVEPGQCSQPAFSAQFQATLKVEPAFAQLENHSSANMFDFSRTGAFGYRGDIFIALTGSLPPGTGADTLIGYKITRIDRRTGGTSDFITHVPPGNTQAIIFACDGTNCSNSFNKPIDVRFRGPEMFIVDMGVGAGAPTQIANSGKVWKVTRIRSP